MYRVHGKPVSHPQTRDFGSSVEPRYLGNYCNPRLLLETVADKVTYHVSELWSDGASHLMGPLSRPTGWFSTTAADLRRPV